MNIIWIIAKPVGRFKEILSGKQNPAVSGGWIDITAERLSAGSRDNKLTIVSADNIKMPFVYEEKNICYYCLDRCHGSGIKNISRKTVEKLKSLFDHIRPDIIQIWGTESVFSSYAIHAANDMHIPCVLYIQGLLTAINKYPFGGLRMEEICGYNIWKRLKYLYLLKIPNGYYRGSLTEKKSIQCVRHIISDNEWCFNFCKSLNYSIITHRHPLQIYKKFAEACWDIKKIQRNTVFCPAERFGYKGLHVLLKAFMIVKQLFPDVKLYVPGENIVCNKTGIRKIIENPYNTYIKNLIKQNDLSDNIEFTGNLSADEMTAIMLKSHIFVMPSSVENQSSTLREAMTLGMPVISSFVGCVGESVIPYNTGLLYRYEEYEILSQYIIQILQNDRMAECMGRNAKQKILDQYPGDESGEILFNIYTKIIANEQ